MADRDPHALGGRGADSLAASIEAGELSASVLDAVPGIGLLVFDHDLRLLLAAGGALSMHGWAPETMRGRLLRDVAPADAYNRVEPHYRAALEGRSSSFELRSIDRSRLYHVEATPLLGADGAVVAGASLGRDVTEARAAEHALREANERFESAFEGAAIGMALVSPEGRFLQVNRSLCEIVGYKAEELCSKTFQDITHPDDLDSDLEYVRQTLAGERRTYQMEKRYFTADGDVVWVLLAVSLVHDHRGEPLHFVSQIEDISERKRAEQRLRYLADHDDLTGLLNRRRFEEEVKRQLARCKRYDERAALLLLDVDGFKRFNDTYGHDFGDGVLRHVAEVIKGRLRGTDALCRIGGDEFTVLLPHTSPAKARSTAESLLESLREAPADVRGQRAPVTASIGVAAIDSGTGDLDHVLTSADKAMYEAKRTGRDRVV